MGKVRLVAIILFLVSVYTMKGQTIDEETMYLGDEWVAAFSEDGRKNWTPEFTIRYASGLRSVGPFVTGGVRIDEKRTFGLMLGQAETFIDAAPGYLYHIDTHFYMRRYFHLGRQRFISLYSDMSVGASWIYKVSGAYWLDPETGEKIEEMDEKPGDVWFYASWEPGIKIRFYRNLHLFFGPKIATDCFGIHFGVGF